MLDRSCWLRDQCYMHGAPLLSPYAGPKSRPNCSTAFSQAVAMQRMLLADAMKPETPARERAMVARAWSELEERKRILRMKPKPKDVDVSEKSRKRSPNHKITFSPAPEFSETPEATAEAG